MIILSHPLLVEANNTTELSYKEKKEILTEVANEQGIPPEILKAIAYNENAMMQFDSSGKPKIAPDGGIGIMQITIPQAELDRRGWDLEKIKHDTRYNIEIGAKWLKERFDWSFIPKVNNHDPAKLEHWYFALMAYNGLSYVNDPERSPSTPYQNKIYQTITNHNIGVKPYIITSFEANYEDGSLHFRDTKANYTLPEAITYSTQMFKAGDRVKTRFVNANLRESAGGAKKGEVGPYTSLEIVSGPYETDGINNHYVFYEVKNSSIHGYVASSNLQHKDQQLAIPNVVLPTNHREPIARTYIKSEVPLLEKNANGTYSVVRMLKRNEALRTYGVDGHYYHVGANQYIENNPNRISIMVGRLLILQQAPMYQMDSKGNLSVYDIKKPGEAIRTYSYKDGLYNVGGNMYMKDNKSQVKYFTGSVTLSADTPLYKPDGSIVHDILKAGKSYTAYGVDGAKIDLGNGYYVINDRKTVRYSIY